MGNGLKTTDEMLVSIYLELGAVKKELRTTRLSVARAERRISQLECTVLRQAAVIEKKDRIIVELRRENVELRTTIDRMNEDQRVAELMRQPDTSSTPASQSNQSTLDQNTLDQNTLDQNTLDQNTLDQGPRYPTKPPGSGKSGRPVGGTGQAPAWNLTPDVVVELRPELCKNGHHLFGLPGTLKESRQVTDISVSTATTEYRQFLVTCPSCKVKSVEPFTGAPARVSYGPGLRALSLFLTQQSHLPLDATAQVLAAFGAPVSRSCVLRWTSDAAKMLVTSGFMDDLRAAILEAPWIGADETPLRLAEGEKIGLRHVHAAVTDHLTHLHSGTLTGRRQEWRNNWTLPRRGGE